MIEDESVKVRKSNGACGRAWSTNRADEKVLFLTLMQEPQCGEQGSIEVLEEYRFAVNGVDGNVFSAMNWGSCEFRSRLIILDRTGA